MRRFLEKELIAWKDRKDHLPLLLRGARQVGKSYLVEHFGRVYFDSLVIADFEKEPKLKKCFSSKDPTEVIQQLEFILGQKIVCGKTLLFFDEIQECPEALVSLRYFFEKMPELHVIAAGSLMEFLLHNEEYSFPVGRVEFLYLRPLSFMEFLSATSPVTAEKLGEMQGINPLGIAVHEELLSWVKKYLFVGGMPAAITTYIETQSLFEATRVHQRILQAYESDFGKYSSHSQHRYMSMIFQKAPSLIGQVLKYSQIDQETRSRDLKPALSLLTHAGLILQMFSSTAAGLPLHAHVRDHRCKLLFLDVGLLQSSVNVDATDYIEKDILQINSGMIAEQFVGQELLCTDSPYTNKSLLFWEREGGSAEVDFLTCIDSQIIPIEVKAGTSGSLRSLHSFLKEKKLSLGVRISEQPLSLENGLLTIPFYLVHALKDLVRASHVKKGTSSSHSSSSLSNQLFLSPI